MQTNFRTKTNTLFLMALAAVIAAGFLSFRETTHLVQAQNWVSHTREVLQTSTSMLTHISKAISARRGFLFGRPQDEDHVSKAIDATLADLADLKNLTADNSIQRDRLQTLEPLIHTRIAMLRQSIELHHAAGSTNDSDAQEVISKQGLELNDQIVEQVGAFRDTESQILRQRLADAAATARRAYDVEIALALSCFVLLIAALALINREISRRERSERATQDAERLMRSILDSSADAILVCDSQGRIILQNAVMAQYHVPSSMPPERWPEAFGVFQRDKQTLVPVRELSLIRAAFHGESVDNMEVYMRPPGCETGRWHLASSRPLLDNAGSPRGGVVFLRDINERKTLEEDRDRLIVRGQLLRAQDEERARIARELHDGVAQSLTMLMIHLHGLKKPDMAAYELRSKIEETEQMCSGVAEEVRSLSHRLHSSKLEYLGFANAAQNLCNELMAQGGFNIELTIENIPSRLPPEVSLGLFRVLQEALQNAIKHAGEGNINVDLRRIDGHLRLRVRDSGVGFNPDERSKAAGLGLVSMRERLSLLGGSFSLQSAPGQGTTVEARVPFTAPQAFEAIAS